MTHTRCRDCGTETLPTAWDRRAEYYMVHDHLWQAAGMGAVDGCLCIGCLEARLGRELAPDDFTDAPVNDPERLDQRYAWAYRTPRLQSRLTRQRAEDAPPTLSDGQLALFEGAAP